MADYHTPTVIQQSIPAADMTPLEALILAAVFEMERDEEGFYLFSETGPWEWPCFPAEELREALTQSTGTVSSLADYVASKIADIEDDKAEVEIDMIDFSWTSILQDIVKRSPTIDHIVRTASFTCSRMRADGFGGMVTVITADKILSCSTHDMEARLLDEAEYGELGVAPGHGVHTLLQFSEADVRAAITEIIAIDPDFASIRETDVTDAGVRAACLQAAATRDLAEERRAAMFAAAMLALGEARRSSPAAS